MALESTGEQRPAQQFAQSELSRLQARDAGAFADLVRANERLVAGLCRKMGLSGADLEDAMAEAFAEIYRALPNYQGRSSVSTWIYRIASRVILRFRTERQSRPRTESQARKTSDPARSPAEVFELRQSQQRIWVAVSQLERRQAIAVELYYRQDHSIDEIASKMNCPAGTVKVLLHRARAALREKLSDER